MRVIFQLKNYRCFEDVRPARFELRDGSTSFIGINNSGKSTLLKFFYEFRPVFQHLAQNQGGFSVTLGRPPYDPTKNSEIREELGKIKADVFCNQNSRDLEIKIELLEGRNNTPIATPILIALVLTRRHEWKIEYRFKRENISIDLGDPAKTSGQPINKEDISQELLQDATKLFECLSQIMYIGPFRNAVTFMHPSVSGVSGQNYFGLQIADNFSKTWHQTKLHSNQNRNLLLRVTEDIQRIFRFRNLSIDGSPTSNDEMKIDIDGRAYGLSEVGAGLSELIFCLGNAAMLDPSFILIDEPETHLHPSMQIEFVFSLKSYAREGICFATHNIGLARIASDHIYSVRKRPSMPSEVVEYAALHSASLAEFLGELSFAGYRELGFDKILLVEGVTEVTAIKELLRKYKKEHEIIILPMGGAEFIRSSMEPQLEEIKRITEHVSALIDSERNSENEALSLDRQGFVDSCQRAKITCKVLERRALENYFPKRAIQEVKGSAYEGLGEYENLKHRTHHGWSNSENWRFASAMTLEELDSTDLGEFLRNL